MMKQRLFSWGDDFYIQDETGQNRFYVDGKVLSLGHQFSFQDLAGQEICFIKQVILSWGQSYEIYKADQLWATVKKELFTFFNCRFEVDGGGQNHVEASGNFLNHQYTFTRGDQTIAQVSKQWFTLADTYGVDVAQDEDDILILASTVVIDMACHKDRTRLGLT
jgi:uncharacterized protein YxjI